MFTIYQTCRPRERERCVYLSIRFAKLSLSVIKHACMARRLLEPQSIPGTTNSLSVYVQALHSVQASQQWAKPTNGDEENRGNGVGSVGHGESHR